MYYKLIYITCLLPRAVVLKNCSLYRNHLENLWKQIAGPHHQPQSMSFSRSGVGPRLCISNKFPGIGDVAGLEARSVNRRIRNGVLNIRFPLQWRWLLLFLCLHLCCPWKVLVLLASAVFCLCQAQPKFPFLHGPFPDCSSPHRLLPFSDLFQFLN